MVDDGHEAQGDAPAGVPQAGDVIDKYEVERVIGQGGMGYVLAARHPQLNQRVAIKCLHEDVLEDPQSVARFLREARACVSLRSKHTARVFDVGTHDSGAPYMVMEHLEGRDLERVLEEDGVLPIERAVDFLLQACEAIAEAHVTNLVHRDLKPGNMFLTEDVDGSPLVKVLDFGIAKVLHKAMGPDATTALTAAGTTVGTPMYMSPEQVRDATDIDGRSDIWSLGIVLYQLLGGTPPFQGTTVPSLCAKIIADPPPPLGDLRPEVPPGLVHVVGRCLEKEKLDRFQTVAELAVALRPFASEPCQSMIERIVGIANRKVSIPPSTDEPVASGAETEAASSFGDDSAAHTLPVVAAATDHMQAQTQNATVLTTPSQRTTSPSPMQRLPWVALAVVVVGAVLLWIAAPLGDNGESGDSQNAPEPATTAAAAAQPEPEPSAPAAVEALAPAVTASASAAVSAAAAAKPSAPKSKPTVQPPTPKHTAPKHLVPKPSGGPVDPLSDRW